MSVGPGRGDDRGCPHLRGRYLSVPREGRGGALSPGQDPRMQPQEQALRGAGLTFWKPRGLCG